MYLNKTKVFDFYIYFYKIKCTKKENCSYTDLIHVYTIRVFFVQLPKSGALKHIFILAF